MAAAIWTKVLEAPPPGPSTADEAEALEAARLDAVLESFGWGGVVAALGAVTVAAVVTLLGYAPLARAAAFGATIALAAAGHFPFVRWVRASPRPSRGAVSAALFALAAVEGGVWGWAIAGVVGQEHLAGQITMLFVGLSVAVGSVLVFAPKLPVFLAFFLPTTVPYAVWAARAAFVLQREAGLGMLVLIPGVIGLAIHANQRFARIVGLRLRAEALAIELAARSRQLEAVGQEKSALLAAAAHDVRQPVHALGLLASALVDVAADPPLAVLARHIAHSAQTLGSLVDGLLDLSRLDAGLVEVRRQPVALEPLLEGLVQELAPRAAAKGIALRLGSCRGVVLSDPVLLARLVRNLMDNAVEHTARGGVIVGVRGRGRLRIEVWDSGPGIAVADQTRIFDDYVRVGDRPDGARGLGLGLAIVRRLATILDHRIGLRSWPGRGSCFCVEAPAATQAPEPPRASASPETRRGVIAVLDDDPEAAEALRLRLEGWGHVVVDSAAGLRDPQLDLIVCDPSGLDALERRRDLEASQGSPGRSVPVLVLTADTSSRTLERARAAGHTVLFKPVAPASLRDAVANLLDRP